MLAFTNTQMTKQELIDRLQTHFDADEIIKGTYWEDGRGCAIGCAIHGAKHSLFEPMFGIPESLACLQDRIFEGLPNEEAKKFPLEFTRSIREGADLSKVIYKFCAWILVDAEHGVIKYSGNPAWGGELAISNVANICAQLALGETVDAGEIEAATRAAAEAARATAEAAGAAAWATRAAWETAAAARAATRAAAAAARAARAAAEAAWATAEAAGAAGAAAAAARAAGAEGAEEEAHYTVMRDKLLELLREC